MPSHELFSPILSGTKKKLHLFYFSQDYSEHLLCRKGQESSASVLCVVRVIGTSFFNLVSLILLHRMLLYYLEYFLPSQTSFSKLFDEASIFLAKNGLFSI